MNRSAARVAFVAGALVAAAIPAALVTFRPDPVPPPRPAQAQETLDRPPVNYRGPIRRVKEHGEDHPAPEVFPRTPYAIVTDDCTAVSLFDVGNSSYDAEAKTVTLYWSDPAAKEPRSLTIYLDSPSCRNHRGAQSWAM